MLRTDIGTCVIKTPSPRKRDPVLVERPPSNFLLVGPPDGSPPFIVSSTFPLTQVDKNWAISGVDEQAYYKDLEVMRGKVCRSGEETDDDADSDIVHLDPPSVEPPQLIDLTMSEDEDDTAIKRRLDRTERPSKRRRLGTVTHQEMQVEVDPGAHEEGTYRPPTFAREHLDKMNKGWTLRQERALWLGQLGLGCGKDWESISMSVNEACPLNSKTKKQCQDKWASIRRRALGV